MPKNVVCKKCNNLVNDWCEKVIDSPDHDMQRDCQYFCEKTNADLIRAMSDEAIAEYVCRNSINTLCDIICGGECNAIATLKKSGDWACKDCRYRGSICCPAIHETIGNGLVDYAVDNGYCWRGKPKET